MSEAKAKRLIVACTVGAVLLMVILVSVLAYQLVEMLVQSKRMDKLDLAISEYQRLYDETEDKKELFNERWWIEREARELGWGYSDKNSK